MDLIIQRLNGEEFVLSQCGIKTLDFVISSPSPRTEYEQIDGRHGFVDLGTTYEGREMVGSFILQAEDSNRFTSSRNEVFRIFQSREPFFLIETREPDKRWFVKKSGAFSIDQIRDLGLFSVAFISSSPYAESIKTTLDPTLFSAQLTGMKPIKYKHQTTTFEIFNDGVEVDPRYMPLVIIYKGTSSNLKIKNLSTNEEWSYAKTSASNDEIRLDGVRSTKNGLSIFRDTNKRLLSLAPGWNEFKIEGASGSFEITFDFRFYTL